MSQIENLNYAYKFFIKPLIGFAAIPDASPTLLRKLATDKSYESLTPLQTISTASGAIIGMKLMTMQISALFNIAEKYDYHYNYIMPLIPTAVSLAYEGIRLGIGIRKEIKQQRLEEIADKKETIPEFIPSPSESIESSESFESVLDFSI